MPAFTHVLTLISFVFAVSLAQILLRISALVAARDKVRASGLSILSMATAILLAYMNWLAMWELRAAGNWNPLAITVMFLFSLSICFICTLAEPQFHADEPIDLDASYWKQRTTYYWSWIVCETLAIIANRLFADSPMALKFLMFPPIFLALAVPKRWAQWVGGILSLPSTPRFWSCSNGNWDNDSARRLVLCHSPVQCPESQEKP